MDNRDLGFSLDNSNSSGMQPQTNATLQNCTTYFAEHSQAGNFLEFFAEERKSNDWSADADRSDLGYRQAQLKARSQILSNFLPDLSKSPHQLMPNHQRSHAVESEHSSTKLPPKQESPITGFETPQKNRLSINTSPPPLLQPLNYPALQIPDSSGSATPFGAKQNSPRSTHSASANNSTDSVAPSSSDSGHGDTAGKYEAVFKSFFLVQQSKALELGSQNSSPRLEYWDRHGVIFWFDWICETFEINKFLLKKYNLPQNGLILRSYQKQQLMDIFGNISSTLIDLVWRHLLFLKQIAVKHSAISPLERSSVSSESQQASEQSVANERVAQLSALQREPPPNIMPYFTPAQFNLAASFQKRQLVKPPQLSMTSNAMLPTLQHLIHGNGPIQLWQFLLELLFSGHFQDSIEWTQDPELEHEFKILSPKKIANWWGIRKNKPKMNYEKLSRGLRYYYDKDVIQKTPNKRYVYRFGPAAKVHEYRKDYEENKKSMAQKSTAASMAHTSLQRSASQPVARQDPFVNLGGRGLIHDKGHPALISQRSFPHGLPYVGPQLTMPMTLPSYPAIPLQSQLSRMPINPAAPAPTLINNELPLSINNMFQDTLVGNRPGSDSDVFI